MINISTCCLLVENLTKKKERSENEEKEEGEEDDEMDEGEIRGV
jgi:hypothetical protein